MNSFLEFAVRSDDILESLIFYKQLGFTELTTTDAYDYGYAVIGDGDITVGLHAEPDFENSVRFVRQNVRRMVMDGVERGLEFEDVHLSEEALHTASLRGPYGNKATWVEARTFSPGIDENSGSLLGQFLEITLPVGELYEAARFWAPYSEHVIGEANDPPHMRLDTGGVHLGLCESPAIRKPVLSFLILEPERLQSAMDRFGIVPSPKPPPPKAMAQLIAPEGTTLNMYRADFIES